MWDYGVLTEHHCLLGLIPELGGGNLQQGDQSVGPERRDHTRRNPVRGLRSSRSIPVRVLIHHVVSTSETTHAQNHRVSFCAKLNLPQCGLLFSLGRRLGDLMPRMRALLLSARRSSPRNRQTPTSGVGESNTHL